MKVKISKAEWYPVFNEGGYGDDEVEIPEELWKKYLEARRSFSDLWAEIQDIVFDHENGITP
jgi:hypothetical protein